MLVTGAVGVILGAFAPQRRVALGAVALGSFLIHPLLAITIAAAIFGGARVREIRNLRKREHRATHDTLLALDLMTLATTSGLPFVNAALMAARRVADPA